MAITIDGKTYRNLQEQVKKNMDDIEELQDNMMDPEDFVSIDTDQTITGEKTFDSNINIINGHDINASTVTAYFGSIYENGNDISDVYATKDDVYTKTEADSTFVNADDVYTKSEVDEMNSDMEDYIDDNIDKVNAIIGDGYLSQLAATFGTNGNYKSVLNLSNLTEIADYQDNGTNNTQFKANSSIYISVEKGSIITLVGYPDYSSYQIITDETTYDNLTGTTTITALSTQVVEIKSLSSSNYYISLNVTNYIKETLTDAIDNINTTLDTKVIQKNADGNIQEKLYLVNGISSATGEDTDNKATISLSSSIRRGNLYLSAGGEDGEASISLTGGTSGTGHIAITGDVTVDSIYRPKVGTGSNPEEVAYLSDIPASVSGVNNGTNWTSITIGDDTYGIPTGGSGSIVAGTGIDITNGVVSVDNTVAMKNDTYAPYTLKMTYTNNLAATGYARKIEYTFTLNLPSTVTDTTDYNDIYPYLPVHIIGYAMISLATSTSWTDYYGTGWFDAYPATSSNDVHYAALGFPDSGSAKRLIGQVTPTSSFISWELTKIN